MVENQGPKYNFCPFCATALGSRTDHDGRVRQACPGCDWVYYPHAAVTAAGLLIDDDRVLLAQRKSQPFAGSWHLPSGFVDYGEHPAVAVVREFAEETGLTVRAGRLLEIFISEDDPREPGHLALFYAMTEPSGTLMNDDVENFGIAWFDVDNLPQIELLNHLRILRDYLPKYDRGLKPER